MIVEKSWNLQEAFNVINSNYYPGGITSGPQRNIQIKTWGQLIGKTRALRELDSLIQEYGSVNKFSKAVQMSSKTIKSLRQFFESLPDELENLVPSQKYQFVKGQKCSLEENLTYEFKEVKGQNPRSSIKNVVDEYILGFLNSSGGSIFWGICDDGLVKGVVLDSGAKDSIKIAINSKIHTIEPSIDPTKIHIVFHEVAGVEHGYVVEVNVPKANLTRLYFNSSGNTWVRVNGCNQKLKGPALEDYIVKRLTSM